MITYTSVFLLFVIIFFIVAVAHSFYWNNKIFETMWVSCFECGFPSSSLMENTFSYTYFNLLVFFVIFDLEVSLLLNLPMQGLLFFNFVFYFIFLLVLSIGLGFEIYGGYVNWGY